MAVRDRPMQYLPMKTILKALISLTAAATAEPVSLSGIYPSRRACFGG
jgi:hypothetical protein